LVSTRWFLIYEHIDQPSAYAFETAEQVARLAEVQPQALSNQRKQFMGKAIACATTSAPTRKQA
jgi:hypothetical protein